MLARSLRKCSAFALGVMGDEGGGGGGGDEGESAPLTTFVLGKEGVRDLVLGKERGDLGGVPWRFRRLDDDI